PSGIRQGGSPAAEKDQGKRKDQGPDQGSGYRMVFIWDRHRGTGLIGKTACPGQRGLHQVLKQKQTKLHHSQARSTLWRMTSSTKKVWAVLPKSRTIEWSPVEVAPASKTKA